jgi:hypothetical protein
LPEEFRQEAFPCQHIDEASWQRIAALPGMPEKVAARFVQSAEELEARAELEESPRYKQAHA